MQSDLQGRFEQIKKTASGVILDKEQEIQLALCCLLARGHLLVEDIPGMGKTTLVITLAKLLGLRLSRIQFTNDLLPADILGNSIFNPNTRQFEFHPGPIFAEVVLADELNRATPKTQSACLQAMEERQVTVDGQTHALPTPFFFIATQNPKQQVGTFALPESQLDRFLMKIEMGYPDRQAERALLKKGPALARVAALAPILNPDQLVKAQDEVQKVHVVEVVLDYLQDLVAYSREGLPKTNSAMVGGISPRAALGFLSAARAHAWLQGRDHVVPQDLQNVALAVMAHRLQSTALAKEVLNHVAVK
jgi:MoxR-like ATPase